ncbi:MAG: pknB, partial [Pedosphaera sp.]|nr:pknB [Pedosphaera sp.]
ALAFIAMEYVDGPTLAGVRLQQPNRLLKWEFLQPLVGQLCEVLEYAHGEKIIHRDLKPSNVMVDSRGSVKLADFGIAATVTDSMSRVSQRHATSGTMLYMSPQQMNGEKPRPTDDIYALGVTLYELLTGKPPFHTGDIPHQVRNIPAQPLAERLAEFELSNDVPAPVSALIKSCLAKDASQRPQSARAFLERLQGGPVADTPITAQTQVSTAPPTVDAIPLPRANETLREVKSAQTPDTVEAQDAARGRAWNSFIVAGVAVVLILGLLRLAFWHSEPKRDAKAAPPRDAIATNAPAANSQPKETVKVALPENAVAKNSPEENLHQSNSASSVSAPAAVAATDVIPAPSTLQTEPPPVTDDHPPPIKLPQPPPEPVIVKPPPLELPKLNLLPVSEPVVPVVPQAGKASEPAEAVVPQVGKTWVNSLGLRFVPVPGTAVLFAVTDTRVQDYQAFAEATQRPWTKPDFKQGPNHPAVNVSWEDATAFCAWLTDKERQAGEIGGDQRYRLPTDAEWSAAVGLEPESDRRPVENDGKVSGIFPWGNRWPPPAGAGNFGRALKTDHFDFTSPVGSFAPNRNGLFDMGGNVREWCEDWYSYSERTHVLRGSSWTTVFQASLLSSCRNDGLPDQVSEFNGFRCVLVNGK